MTAMRTQRSATLLLLLWIGVSSASAQTVSRSAGRGAWPQGGQERLIEIFLDHATAELNLTLEQRTQLGVVLSETMDRRAELARTQFQLHREIREALSNPATEDDQFRRLTDAILAVKRQEVDLLDWQEGRLLEVLTPRQTLRFMMLQQQLAQRIEEMRKKKRNP